MDLSKIKYKKKGGIIGDLVGGVGGLIILVIITLVVISTLLGANLLTTGEYNDTAQDMAKNFTAGLQNVSSKLPVILLIAAVVLLFGVLVILVARSKQMGSGGGSGTL